MEKSGTMNPTEQRLQAVFREFFNDDAIELQDGTTFSDIRGWDSLAHVNLINALEVEFGLKFGVRQLRKRNGAGAPGQLLRAKSPAAARTGKPFSDAPRLTARLKRLSWEKVRRRARRTVYHFAEDRIYRVPVEEALEFDEVPEFRF